MGKNPIQSIGAYEILNAVDRNAESAMEELYLDDIPVNAQFERLLEEVLDVRPNLNVQCGVAMKGKDRVSRMKKEGVSIKGSAEGYHDSISIMDNYHLSFLSSALSGSHLTDSSSRGIHYLVKRGSRSCSCQTFDCNQTLDKYTPC